MSSRACAAGEYLDLLARILAASGYSRETLREEFDKVCRSLPEPKRRAGQLRLDEVLELPHVLAHWHTDPEFLDAAGRPRALPLRGTRSLETLIRRVFPEAPLKRIVQALKRNGALSHRDKRYRPRGRSIRYGAGDVHLHGLAALLGLLRTFERNVAGSQTAPRLFERSATNSRVPVRFLRAFARRVHRQSLALLFSLDSEMKRLELARRGDERTARVGVGVYLFEEAARKERS